MELSQAYGKLPLSFEANEGQTDPRVTFLSRGNGYSLFLTQTEAVLVLKKAARDNNAHPGGLQSQAINDQPKTSHSSLPAAVLRMKLVGGNASARIAGAGELPGKSNYFVGSDPKQWRANLSNYPKVEYRDVYPGIDLVYYGNQRQLEYDFVVAPGADPAQIQLGFKGARKIRVDARGDLLVETTGGSVRWQKPVVYQESDGVRKMIKGKYLLRRGHQASFEVAAYDTTKPLIIDPTLVYSTYLGGTFDQGSAIAVDSSGNAYVTGFTDSTNFPTTFGAFQTTFAGFSDAFVSKLDPTGTTLVYSTYLGGGGSDSANGIAVDTAGNAYVTGRTDSLNFPTTVGALQTSKAGGAFDAFISKLDPTGFLVYSTYLGGGGIDIGNGIAVDSLGNAYVTGRTDSSNFPTTPGAFLTGLPFAGITDAFVSKLDPTGTTLVYSTYLGGTQTELGNGIAVDSSGNAYVTGQTSSLDFPTTGGAFQTSKAGAFDAFISKLDPIGKTLVYSTYLGGGGSDIGNGIAVDSSGNAYVTGLTTSTNFPTTPGTFQTMKGLGQDAFITKLDPTGSALVYSTYLGGNSTESGNGIAVDAFGDAYVTGFTTSTNFPTTAGAFQTTYGGANDVFLTTLNASGTGLLYSTYLGGGGNDQGKGIAVDASGNAYVTGFTTSTDFPTTLGAFQTAQPGSQNAFVAKFGGLVPAPVITVTDGDGNPIPCGGAKIVSNNGQCSAATVPLRITASGSCPGTPTVTSTRSDGKALTDPYPVGSTTVTSTATDGCGNTTTCTATVTVTNDKTITSNFNGTSIPGGSYLWFNAVIKPSGLKPTGGPVMVKFIDQKINSGNFTVNPPDTTVIFDPSVTCASATVTATGEWLITAPKSGLSGNTFLSGASYQVPAAGLPGGIKPVTWSGTFITDTAGVGLDWKWAAAVYSTFNADNAAVGVKVTDDNHHDCTYLNSDHAGTPETYKSNVIGGATGGGGSNYTGGLSGTQSVSPCDTF